MVYYNMDKKCSICGVVKDTSFFTVDKQKRDGFRSNCRECLKKDRVLHSVEVSQKQKERRLKNVEETRRKDKIKYWKNRDKIMARKKEYWHKNRDKLIPLQRSYYIRRKYGLTMEERLSIIKFQEYKCPICQITLSEKWVYSCIDHDHAITNKRESVRGILCWGCNKLLTLIDKEGVSRIVIYLNNPPAKKILNI